MKKILNEWYTFVNEGIAARYKFDAAIDVIAEEVMSALKRGIDNSPQDGQRIEFYFVNGESESGRALPQEIANFVRKIEGVVRFVDSIESLSSAGVVGSYQQVKKLMKLFVNVPVGVTERDILASSLMTKIKSTLRHEFEHTLDSLRGLEKKAHGLGYGSLEEYYDYFASPHEVNAYVAGFLKRAEITGRPFVELKDNFLNWLKNDLKEKVEDINGISLKVVGSEKANISEVEDFIDKIDALFVQHYKDRYGDKKSDNIP